MYNWLTVRKIARTDASNYPVRAAQTVDATVRTWAPIFAAALACFVTPSRGKLDSRYYEQPTYPVRAVQTVDATVCAWAPVFDAEIASERVRQRPPLDVRTYEWQPERIDWMSRVDAQVRTWIPAFDGELASFVPPARPDLDVHRYDWAPDESGWIKATLTPPPTVAQTVPAWAFDGDRTPDRARLDVRRYDWTTPEEAWIAGLLSSGPTVAQTAPAWSTQDDQFVTRGPAKADLFRLPTMADIFGVPDDWITWVPIQDTGGLTRDRARLDVRSYKWAPDDAGWITKLFAPPATTAQTSPAWTDDGGRIAARQTLDVRNYDWSPEFGWIHPVATAPVASWAPVFSAEASSFRTLERPKLDVRFYKWSPDEAAWELVNFAPPVTVPQMLPALVEHLHYQTSARAKLDVRLFEWAPEFGWVTRVVDASVAQRAGMFAPLGYWPPAKPRTDVRLHLDPTAGMGWLSALDLRSLQGKIHLIGSYRPQIALTGSYRFTIALIGSIEST